MKDIEYGLRSAAKILILAFLKNKGRSDLNKEIIRSIRFVSGLSQDEFAREIGVSYNTAQSWELGRRRPGKISWQNMQERIPLLLQ